MRRLVAISYNHYNVIKSLTKKHPFNLEGLPKMLHKIECVTSPEAVVYNRGIRHLSLNTNLNEQFIERTKYLWIRIKTSVFWG